MFSLLQKCESVILTHTHSVHTVCATPMCVLDINLQAKGTTMDGFLHLRDSANFREIPLALSYAHLPPPGRSVMRHRDRKCLIKVQKKHNYCVFYVSPKMLCCFGSDQRTKQQVLQTTGFLWNTHLRSKFINACTSSFAEEKIRHLRSYMHIFLKYTPKIKHTHISILQFPDLCVFKWNNPFCLHTIAQWDKHQLHCIQKWSLLRGNILKSSLFLWAIKKPGSGSDNVL